MKLNDRDFEHSHPSQSLAFIEADRLFCLIGPVYELLLKRFHIFYAFTCHFIMFFLLVFYKFVEASGRFVLHGPRRCDRSMAPHSRKQA